MMKPMTGKQKPKAMNGDRSRVKSEAKARMSSTTAPVIFGATVYKLVLTEEYFCMKRSLLEQPNNNTGFILADTYQSGNNLW